MSRTIPAPDLWILRPAGSETTAEPAPHSTNALAYLITTPQRGRWLGFLAGALWSTFRCVS